MIICFIVALNPSALKSFVVQNEPNQSLVPLSSRYRYSDKNLKENITPVASSLDKVVQLRPVSYNYKQVIDYEQQAMLDTLLAEGLITQTEAQEQLSALTDVPVKTELGFIAQEVQLLFPEVVNESPQGTLYLDYVALIPLLVKALQEQQIQINSLEDQVKILSSNNK